MKEFPKGSEWRKWDLHFHTPSSYDYKDKSLTNEDIVNSLVDCGVSVVAVTDHHVIDVRRITELQNIGSKKGLTVLPGIELRSELGGSESVHFIGIFPDVGVDLEEIWLQIQAACNLKPSDIATNGNDSVYADLKDTCELFHSLGGLVTIHAGKKSNSIECITNTLPYKMAIKKEISGCVDIFELGREMDAAGYREHVFPNIGKNFPMIICSDNHDSKTYPESVKQNLWIKADPTFNGLKQILYEPEGRICIQSECPDDKNGYEVIDKVRFIDRNSETSLFANDWIEMNSGLNSIIGGKSSGKSLLLYQIAKTIDPVGAVNAVEHGERSIRYSYAYDIDFEVMWRDGVIYRLSDGGMDKERPVTFIPQLYLNAVAEERGDDFHEVIRAILLAKPEYARWFQEKQREIDSIKKDIHVGVNDYMSLLHRRSEEIDNLKKMGDKTAIERSVIEQKRQMDELKKNSTLSDRALEEYGKLEEEKRKKTELLNTLQSQTQLYGEVGEKISTVLHNTVSRSAEGVASELRTKYSSLEGAAKFIDEVVSKFVTTLGESIEAESDAYRKSLPDVDLAVKQTSEELDGMQKAIVPFAEKIKNKEAFEKLEKAIVAEEQKLQAIEAKRKEIESVRVRLGELNLSKKLDALLNVYKSIIEENCRYRTIDEENDTLLISELGFDGERFRENVINRIAKRSALAKQLDSEIFDDNNDYVFREESYVSDMRFVFERIVSGALKLNQGTTIDDVVHGLLDDYFRVNFDLEQHGDRLLEMSPGKRGIILFQLYLHLSNASHPILIDQPEDNLDNRTVYRELNDFVKEKKLQRQIIIVSHNANLVVSTDSEEVIVANQSGQKKDGDNAKYRFEYVTGALENSFSDDSGLGILYKKGVREHVCEILEGGLHAFKKRESQYASIKEAI